MKLKEIREMYPEGTQIVLTEMAGESQMPYGLKGTVKFVDDAGQIHMSWENGSSLALNIHEDTFEKVEAPEKISVILVEPGRYPKLIEIEDTLEAMQSLVEGDIEEYMPFEDEVAIICNDEGKMNGLPLNRAVYSEPENVEMSYPQLKAHFRQAEKERNHTTGYIVFTADSFDKPYTEEQGRRNSMEAVIVDYWKRIPKESFQNWYKSQSRYRTKEDREKDALLEDATITMPEMAQLLGTTRSSVYTILDNPKYSHFFEFIVIAEKKRITKESFQKFLEGQDRYKLDPSNDYEELAQEQNIALANFRRKKLSQTGIRGSNGNIKYLTFDEASYLAKVSRSMINKWADKGKFTVIKVGSRVRIRRDEFEDWMEQRDLERSMQ